MITPSWADYGTHDEAYYPELWRDCVGAWAPGLGPTGPKLYDVSRNGNHGIPSAGGWPAWAVNDGYALDFAGNVNYQQVNCGSAAGNLTAAKELSVSAWALSRTNAIYRGIISVAQTQPPNFVIYWVGSPFLAHQYQNTTFYSVFNPAPVWFHVCSTNSHKDNKLRFYINGVLIHETTAVTLTANNDNLFIGCDYLGAWAGGERNWNGLIDAVSIHHRALSPDEIRALAAHRLLAYIPRRRSVRRTYSIPASFNPAWARHSNIYIPAGARLA